MPQETNLNVSPYFDDFDPQKDYYKVLFKPGYPIQARELNNLQSIAQYQIEQFGKHIFKEGSVVIPGQLRYENPIYAIQIQSEYNGIAISSYFDQLLGSKIRGQSSGVTAEVVYLLNQSDSEKNNFTLYVKYLQSGGENFDVKIFSNSETLLLQNSITYGNTTIQSGQGFANTLVQDASGEGTAVSVASGVYFVRGTFVRVHDQTILLDQYGINPSYKVGFDVLETVVSSYQDDTLFDNAQGFTNYAAPGADRFKLELILSKKNLDDTQTDSFVEILRVENGNPKFFNTNPQYNILREQLARRTYDESGDYFVKPFTLFVRDCLNDRTLSNGMFFENQKTASGNVPSEDLMVYEIGPGKAYVKGYDVETISATLLDVPKARTTKSSDTQAVTYNSGALAVVNNVYGSVTPGLGTDSVVSLMDTRIGSTAYVAAGTTIGKARVYDFVPQTSYVDDTSRFDLKLFDIQTYTIIGLTTSFKTNLSTPTFIEGRRSNASGYLVSDTTAANTGSLTLYQVSGRFIENEPIRVNGIDDSRIINSVTDYSIGDIKSIYSQTGISTFNADLVLSRRSYISSPGTTFNITASSGGISTVSAGLDKNFINLIKDGDIISYSSVGSDPVFNEVTAVSAGGTFFNIKAVTTVSGVCNGSLSTTAQNITNIIKIECDIPSASSLMTRLGNENIATLDFAENEVIQRRVFSGSFTGNQISVTIPSEDTDIFFESFDEDRYVLSYNDGTYEDLRSDQFLLSLTGKTVTLSNLTKASGNYQLISTVKNTRASSKSKQFNKTSSIVISKSKLTSSGIGTTTLNDGLTYSQIYGTRVQDREISLNVPDVVRFLSIFESENTSDPVLPNLTLSGFSGPSNSNSDFIVGEEIKGLSSGAVAIVINKLDSNKLEYVNLNTFTFSVGEVVVGKESSIQAIVDSKLRGSKNVSNNYYLDDGQRSTYYDYSRIIRKRNVSEPKGRLRVIYQNYTIKSSDTGEFITANSYSQDNFKHNVPYWNNSRLTDYIDIRPRVGTFTSTTRSPFEFNSRNFAVDGQYSEYILASGENITLNYTYYLGRIDKVILRPDGLFENIQGEPSDVPREPVNKTDALDIATIYIQPYTYNTKNVTVDMTQHRRYRMSDISKLEDRIQRLEKYTTLTMLEIKTENLVIKDSETGLDRFKCGFFVDNFANHMYHDTLNPSFRSAIDTSKLALRPKHYTTSIDLQLGSEAISGVGQTFNSSVDQSYVTDLGSPGVRKTGDLITLDYNETLYYEQPYATKTESVTPFLVRYWQGIITLNPPIDSWIEEQFLTSNNLVTNTTTDIVSDENITIVNNVIVDETISLDPPTTQLGIPGFDWVQNARNVLSGVRSIGGVPVNLDNNSLRAVRRFGPGAATFVNNGFQVQNAIGFLRNSNVLHLEIRGGLSRDDQEIIRQILPPDLADRYIQESFGIQRARASWPLASTVIDIDLDSLNPSTSTSTSTTTNRTQSSIVIPEEILIDESVSESISNYTEPVRFVRSRNVEFDVKGLRPVTRFYPFFEGIDVSNYIVPKLLEIEMVSGKFQIGETVNSGPFDTQSKIAFRLCKPNHKTGPFDGSNPPSIINPVPIVDFTTGEVLPQDPNLTPKPDVFTLNPYTQQSIEGDYSESSTFLNVDTLGLQLPSETDYFGLVRPGMTLIGSTSGAVARVRRIRLVSDNSGRLLGSLFIPDPKIIGNPKWTNGQNTFTVIDTPNLNDLDVIFDEFIANSRITESSAEAEYSSSGIINIEETSITTTRNIRIIPERTVTTTTTTNTNTTRSTVNGPIVAWETFFGDRAFGQDPLAQSFYVREKSGVFLTSCDIFFETKDDSIPVTFQIRPMIAGVPSTLVVPFSEVTLEPDQVNVSLDGTIATKIRFPSPVYLNGPTEIQTRNAPIGSEQSSEYAMVLLSGSPNYRVFCSELGQNDIYTGVKVSQQYTLGSMFKSQNGSVWSPAQLEDLRYRLYRADFVSQGLVRFFNPKLSISNKKVSVTGSNQLLPLSKKVVVGLGSTGFNTTNVVPGVSLVQGSATGTLVSIGGSILVGTGASVINVGAGYSASVTFSGVSLESETGVGFGAQANITTNSSGQINVITITSGGNAYSVGDILVIPSDASINSGYGAKFQVTSIGSTNTFVIDNVQGTFTAGVTTISYINSSGITTYVGAGVTASSVTSDQYYDGLHMKIYQPNHGMHSSENYVEISKMRPTFDGDFADTTTELEQGGTNVTLDDATAFSTFEGVSVSALNPGYALIGYEVFEYTAVSGNTLTISARGVDGTQVSELTYPIGTTIEKYEFNGISLRRINKVHNLSLVDQTTHPTTLNSYHIQIEMGATDFEGTGIGSDRTNDRYFLETVQKGRSGTNITNNIQFEVITPNFANIVPSQTSLTGRMRTFSGTSVDGSENSFTDLGFEPVIIGDLNYLSTPRVICSRENEERHITTTPGSKSLTMEFVMESENSFVSPVIDTIKTSVILTSNLVNSPNGIGDDATYATTDNTRSLFNDDHSAIYISKPVRLAIPANSLKVLLSASRNTQNDIRVLYQLFRSDAPEISQNFELFPGYSNYTVDGQGIRRVIDNSLNDGSSDVRGVQNSDRSFRDYEYTVENLPTFDAFAIKIVMASENQATPPMVRQLRAIATIKPTP
jgi:hypothetical protein